MRQTKAQRRGRASVVNAAPAPDKPGHHYTRPGQLTARPLAPVSHDADDYTIALYGSEGSSFTPMQLDRTQLGILLAVEDRINSHAKASPFAPELAVFYGGIVNVGTDEDPVWEPKGTRVQGSRIVPRRR
jgi:hypothetical protein